MTDLELVVLKVLHNRYGMVHSIDRDRLLFEVNVLLDRPHDEWLKDDRAIRAAIESLRQRPEGAAIMSSSSWSGYWLLDDYDKFESFYQEERAAAMSRMARLRKQRDLLRAEWVETKPQMEMFG